MNEKILVVDDDINIKNLIEIYLKNDGYNVETALNGEEALNLINKNSYELVLLDIMMPILNGIETCLKIREKHSMPIIFLSAKDEEIDKLTGLTIGGNAYITKPFQSIELLTKVKSQLNMYAQFNRNENNLNNDLIIIDDLIINKFTKEVIVRDKKVKLTQKEFDILNYLATNKGNVFSIETLYEHVLKKQFVISDTSIVANIANLRRKIELDLKSPQYIKTVWGVGYKI